MATATLPDAASVIGAAVPRIDGPLKTTGTAQYAVDYDFPGLAHAVAVQSTIANGRIRSLDASAAEKMPGVRVHELPVRIERLLKRRSSKPESAMHRKGSIDRNAGCPILVTSFRRKDGAPQTQLNPVHEERPS